MRDDQATGLRRLFAPPRPTTIAVAGEGATPIALDLAVALARLGRRVLVVDRSRGEAPALYGLKVRYDLVHLLDGHKRWSDVALAACDGVTLLPAARGLDEIACEGRDWQSAIGVAMGRSAAFDVWLVNGVPPPGSECSAIVLPIAPTAQSITGAYARIKALQHGGRHAFHVLVYGAKSEAAAFDAFRSVADTAQRFLRATLEYCGAVPAPARSHPSTDAASPRARAFTRLAEMLVAPTPARTVAC